MNPKPGRPASVTWLVVGVLFLSAGNASKFFSSLTHYRWLKELKLSVPPVYLLASGGFWSLVGLGLGIGLWRGTRRARQLTIPAAVLYTAQFWLNRLFLSAASTANLNWPFAALVNVFALALIWLVLTRPGARRFFHWSHP